MQDDPILKMIREVCALGRARLERPHTETGDFKAAQQLVSGLKALDPEGQPSDIGLSLDLLRPRAPYFDQLVLDALANGISQIVNLGVGHDDRALRFSAPAVRYFDLDLPHVIADRAIRIGSTNVDSAQISLIEVDFASNDIVQKLASAGHAAERPTLFIAEHLMLFLRPDEVERLIAATADLAAKHSLLAITAEVHDSVLSSQSVVTAVDEQMFVGTGPLHTIDTRKAWRAQLERHGWKLEAPDHVTAVDHFSLNISGEAVRIQTQFLTAVRRRQPVLTRKLRPDS